MPGKDGALAGRACHRNVTAHQPHQVAADGKPKAGSLPCPCAAAFHLHEFSEQIGHFLFGDTDTGVLDAHLKPERVAISSIRADVHMHHDIAFIGEFDGIADQVE